MKNIQKKKHCLSVRKPECIATARAKDLTKSVLKNFFELMYELVNELGVEDLPNHFYNQDEVGLLLDPKAQNCFIIMEQKMLNF